MLISRALGPQIEIHFDLAQIFGSVAWIPTSWNLQF